MLYSRTGSEARTEIRLLALSDGGDRLLTRFDNDGASATWSADGDTIFVSHSVGNDNSLWAYPAGGGKPWRILSTGEYIGRLSAGPNDAYVPFVIIWNELTRASMARLWPISKGCDWPLIVSKLINARGSSAILLRRVVKRHW